jgi:hypothetical protein
VVLPPLVFPGNREGERKKEGGRERKRGRERELLFLFLKGMTGGCLGTF